ncbi:hypothetical protein [Actinacidiphila glaucinigra]
MPVRPARKSEQIKPKSSVGDDLSAAEFTWDNFRRPLRRREAF